MASKSIEHALVTTGFDFPNFRVTRTLGIARGIIVRSRSIVGNVGASIQTLFGGNTTLYAQLCEQSRDHAFDLMLRDASEKGASAVIGMRFDARDCCRSYRSPRVRHCCRRRTEIAWPRFRKPSLELAIEISPCIPTQTRFACI